MKKAFKFLTVLIVLLTLFVMGFWYFGLPDHYISSRIEQLDAGPFRIGMEGFRKGLFFNFSADSVVVGNHNAEVWRIDDFKGRIRPLGLLVGKAEVGITGESYGGDFSGTMVAQKNERSVEIAFRDIDISRIPNLKSAGLDGKGRLSGSLLYSNNSGTLEFILNNAEMKGFSKDGMYVPLKYFHTVRGAVALSSPGDVRIKSVSLEGKDVYVRLKGEVVNGRADLELEIMPEPSFPDGSLLMLVEKYKISDGYYYIPVKRTL